jgi:chorismate mutase
MAMRGIRGAISVKANTKGFIVAETKELLEVICAENEIVVDDVASIFFSVTQDLNAEFPAVAARAMGFTYTPLFCMTEIPVPGSLAMCIRILVHINSDKPQKEMHHIYLKNAESLRPDTCKTGEKG